MEEVLVMRLYVRVLDTDSFVPIGDAVSVREEVMGGRRFISADFEDGLGDMYYRDFAWHRDERRGADFGSRLQLHCEGETDADLRGIWVAGGFSSCGSGHDKRDDDLIGEWDHFTLVFIEQENDMPLVA